MKLGLITQIRDGIDMLEVFLKHIDALFDYVFIIDHQSTDGTMEVVKQAVTQRPLWEYYFLDSKTILQAETSNLLMHEAFKKDINFLFFLDVDEFIKVESRAELENRLLTWIDHSTVCCMNWMNCICQSFSNKTFTFQTPIWTPPSESLLKKVIIPRELYFGMEKKVKIQGGNHTALSPAYQTIQKTKIGNLLHIPIISRDQAIKKVIFHVISRRGYKARKPGASFHIYEMLEKIAEGNLSEDDLRGFTIGYERSKLINTGICNSELQQRGYLLETFEKLNIAYSNNLNLCIPEVNLDFDRQVAFALNKLESNIPSNIKLQIMDGVISIDQKSLHNKTFDIEHIVAWIEMQEERVGLWPEKFYWKIVNPLLKKANRLLRKT